MTIKINLSLDAVDEKIDYYINCNEAEPYEDGPEALHELYKYVINGIAKDMFIDPAAVALHVQGRLREYMEED